MLPHYGIAQVLRVEEYVQDTIRLTQIGKGGYPRSRPGDRCNHPLVDHVIKGALYPFSVLIMYLPLGMLNRDNIGVNPDGVGPGHVPYGIEGVWKDSFRATMSWTTAVDVGEGALSIFTLGAGLYLIMRGWEMLDLRAGRGCTALIEGLLC